MMRMAPTLRTSTIGRQCGLAAVAFTVCAGGLIGCARPRPFEDLWVEPRPYRANSTAVRPPAIVLERRGELTDPPPATNPTGEITLRDAVGLALRHNPALASAGWAATAAEADAKQMGRPPNPRASLVAENFAGPDAGDVFERQTLRLSQVIELANKRAKRQALGEAAQRLRAWDYEQERIDVAATAALRYVAVVVSQERVLIAENQLALAETGYAVADDRVRNGAAPGLERDQAAARVALGRIALEQARQDLTADRADLAAAWGAEQPAFQAVIGKLEDYVELPPIDVLQQRLEQSPRLARWEDEIAQRQRALDLRRANAVADPTVGAGLRYFPDADDAAGVVELSLPLTVFDDNRNGILAARLRVAQARSQRQQAHAEASQTLTRAYSRQQYAAYALESLDQDALPAARSTYNAALDSYRGGLTDYLTVLDAERTLLDIRNRWLDAVRSYHFAVIEIEQVTAQALQDAE